MHQEQNEELKKQEAIDMTPTWKQVLKILVEVAVNGKNAKGRVSAWSELNRMAELADSVNGKYLLSAEQYDKVKHLLTNK